jgi:hypothetical protein
VYEQPSLLGPGALGPSLWPGWLTDPDTKRRFTAKVHHRSPTACWYWTGAIGSDGHGRFRAGSRTTGTSRVITAHLYAYQLEHGLLDDRPLSDVDLVVRHRCDEASCQNPGHLNVGTAADNVEDYHARRWRHHSPLGDARGTAGRARAIRAAIASASPELADAAVAAAIAAGHPDDHQLLLPIALTRSSQRPSERPTPGGSGFRHASAGHTAGSDLIVTTCRRSA